MTLKNNILLRKSTSVFLLMLFLGTIVFKAVHHHDDQSSYNSSKETSQVYQSTADHCDICSFSIPTFQLPKLILFGLLLILPVSKVVIENYQLNWYSNSYGSNLHLRAPPII